MHKACKQANTQHTRKRVHAVPCTCIRAPVPHTCKHCFTLCTCCCRISKPENSAPGSAAQGRPCSPGCCCCCCCGLLRLAPATAVPAAPCFPSPSSGSWSTAMGSQDCALSGGWLVCACRWCCEWHCCCCCCWWWWCCCCWPRSCARPVRSS